MTPTCNLRDLKDPDRVVALAKDAALVAIGFAVLGFQKAQVLRREIERSFASRTN